MIKVTEYKEPQSHLLSEKFLTPQKLYLPLSQHTGKPSVFLFKPGDSVKEAELIATADGYISACLHAPLSGKVMAVCPGSHPILGRADTVILQPEGPAQQYLPRKEASFSKEKLIGIIAESGIVGMGGAAFPAQVKLKSPKPIDTLIINGCECEPYLTADHRLMLENLKEIFAGIEIICRMLEPKAVIFAIEENKADVVKQLNLYRHTKRFNLPNLSIAVLPSRYPQGAEKQLIYSLSRRKVPAGKLPLDVGCLVHNVATCFAIYEAVYYHKPLIERLVSFCGDALVTPKNIWLKVGTSLRELFDQKILEFRAEPEKIICGGPMMGIAIDSLDYPVLKSSGGFLFLSQKTALGREDPCIRCGACVRECPVQIMPCLINLAGEKWLWEEAKKYSPLDCIECGICSYVCPANRRLVQSIKRVKLELKK